VGNAGYKNGCIRNELYSLMRMRMRMCMTERFSLCTCVQHVGMHAERFLIETVLRDF